MNAMTIVFTGAETLRRTKVRATPFISDYRTAAIATCVLLFVAEILIDALRVTLSNTRFSPVVITVVFYVVVSIVLVVSYLICAFSIHRRIENMGAGKVERLHQMTIRFALSAGGYLATILLEIITAAFSSKNAWATQILYNLVFAALNWTAMMQIIGLKPLPIGSANTQNPNTAFSDRADLVDSAAVLHTIQ